MYALNTSMNRTRSDYYEGNYTPHMFTNGFDSGSSLNAWVEDPKKYMNEVSFLELSFQGASNSDNFNFAITAKSLIITDDSSDLRLDSATVPPQLRWNSSTIKVIAWVQNYRTKEILQAADFTF